MDTTNGTNISFVGFDSDFITRKNDSFAKENILVIVFMCVIMIVGTFGNLLVLIVHRLKSFKRTGTMYLHILAGIDFASCVLIHPYVIHKLYHFYGQSVYRCKISYFFTHCSLAIQVMLLTAIAIDRCYTMGRPLDIKRAYRRMRVFTGLAFVFGVLISLPIIELYGIYTVKIIEGNKEFDGHTCYYSDHYQGSKMLKAFQYFRILLFTLCAAIIVVMYVKIGKTLRKIQPVGNIANCNNPENRDNSDPDLLLKQMGILLQNDERSSKQSSSSVKYEVKASTSNGEINTMNLEERGKITSLKIPGSNENRIGNETRTTKASSSVPTNIAILNTRIDPISYHGKRSRTVVKILFLVTAIFIATWLPFWLVRLTSFIVKTHNLKSLDIFFSRFFYLNNAINPILYGLVHKAFINDCKNWFRRIRQQVRNILPSHTFQR